MRIRPVRDIDRVLFFEDHVDLRLAATSVIVPMTALCLKYMMLDKGASSFILAASQQLPFFARVMAKVALRKNLKPIVILETQD